MRESHCIPIAAALLAAAVLLAGCHDNHDPDHAHGPADVQGGHGAHGHGEDSSSGASFKAGQGVRITEETKAILGVTVADVTQRNLPNSIFFTVQVFGEKHRHVLHDDDHSGCDVNGSGFLATRAAADVKPGQPVEVLKDATRPLGGVVLAVQKALALGEFEVIIGVSNAMASIQDGEFVPARIRLPRDGAVAAIPTSALLRTLEGTFVYAVNGEAYFRVAVKAGVEAGGWAEIAEGLYPGDQVVTTPVQTLWLIELRATKGGGHSH
jgi:hypothetical protein